MSDGQLENLSAFKEWVEDQVKSGYATLDVQQMVRYTRIALGQYASHFVIELEKMSGHRTVKLTQCWMWQCKCGRINFAKAVIAELSPYEQIEVKRDHGFDDDAVGEILTVPTVVTCVKCGLEFDAEVSDESTD